MEQFRRELGGHGRFRSIEEEGGTHVLPEAAQTYNDNSNGIIATLPTFRTLRTSQIGDLLEGGDAT